MIDVEKLVNEVFDNLMETCDFSRFKKEENLILEWIERFKKLYLGQFGNTVNKTDYIMIICEHPYGKFGRERIDVVLEKANGEKVAIEFKFLPKEGTTGESRAISRYVTNAIKDIIDLDHYINDTELNVKTAFFFMVTEKKNILEIEYTCQKDIENFSRGDRISITDEKILRVPNGELTIKWERDKNGEIMQLGNYPYFYVLRVLRKK